MRTITLLAGALMLAACAGTRSTTTNAGEQLRAANAAYDKALIDGDATALNRLYTDDFRIIDDDANISDKQEQIRFITKNVDVLDGKSDDVRVTMLGPASALMTGRFIGRYRYKGKEDDFVERYTSVWVRDADLWKLKHEHSSIRPKDGHQPS